MIGIIVALFMLIFHADLTHVMLALIGFELFGVNVNLSYFRRKDTESRNRIGRAIQKLKEVIADAGGDGEGSEGDSQRDEE